MKKGLAYSLIAILAVLAIAFASIHFTNNADKVKQIEMLNADVTDKVSQIEDLHTDITDKAKEIETLNKAIMEKDSQIEILNGNVVDKTNQIETLNTDVTEKINEIETLNTTVQEKDEQIKTLTEEVNIKAEQIESLENDNKIISEQGKKDKETIENLNAQAESDLDKIKELEEKIVTLNAQIEALIAAKNADINSEEEQVQGNNKVYHSISDKLITLNTGHFTISVPESWESFSGNSNGWHYYYAEQTGHIKGGYLAIKETDDALEYASSDDNEIHEVLASVARGIIGDREGETEYVKIHGMNL